MLRSLRESRFRLLFFVMVFSMLGDRALFVVLGIAAKDLTGSYSAAGLTYVISLVPSLLAPMAAVVMDRARPQSFLAYVCLVTASCVLGLLWVSSGSDVWIIYVVSFAYGLSFFLTSATLSALIKQILPDADLRSANGLLQTARQSLQLVAPLVGAGVHSLGGLKAVALFDAATFVLAAIVVLRIHTGKRESSSGSAAGSLIRAVAAGAEVLWRDRELRRTTISVSVGFLFFGATTTTVFAIANIGLGRSTGFAGVLISAQGVGAVVGGIASVALMQRVSEQWAVAIGMMLFGVSQLALVSSNLVVIIIFMAVGGCGMCWLLVGVNTIIQRRSPAEFIARSTTAFAVMHGIPQTLSTAAGALLVQHWDYRLVQVGVGFGVATTAVVLMRSCVRSPSSLSRSSAASAASNQVA